MCVYVGVYIHTYAYMCVHAYVMLRGYVCQAVQWYLIPLSHGPIWLSTKIYFGLIPDAFTCMHW